MRIALIERPDPANANLRDRFAGVAQALRMAGHETIVINADGLPRGAGSKDLVLTALNRAVSSTPLIEANSLAHHLTSVQPDIIVAPLRGGIAQGVLMARACGEGFAEARIALWCDTPTRAKFLKDDGLSDGIAPFVCDALERQACMLADALVGPDDLHPDILTILGSRSLPSFRAALPTREEVAGSAPRPEMITEIVFVGPMTRHAGLMEFVEAVEALSKAGVMAGRTVTFLGPAASTGHGIGKEWLGLRAANWCFPFKVLDLSAHEDRSRYLNSANRLAVGIADDPDELLLLDRRHVAILRRSDNPPTLLRRIKDALTSALTSIHEEAPCNREDIAQDWPTLVSQIAALPRSAPMIPARLRAGVTIAILHYNRLQQLREAIASVPDEIDGHPIELIVLDNASPIPSVTDEIARIAGLRQSIRIVGFKEPVPQATAYNLALRDAQFETVLFLDDDNHFVSGGIRRLANALAADTLDIVVAALDVFDHGNSAAEPSVGRLIFLGAAYSAGLFFNAFGDTAMAVRRDSFLRLGGFHDISYTYPSLDWVTLAKAQANGLRIGALQWPAVHYRRDTLRADTSAKKLDFEGARSLVFEAYGTSFDAALLARYAQKMQFEEL